MTVTFVVPGPLRPLTEGRAQIALPGAPRSVAEALAGLWRLHPELQARILDEQGQVRPHVNVFVGRLSIRETGGLDTPLGEGAEIAIIPAVSGGSYNSSASTR